MKKFFLVIFILVDMVVIAACGLFLYSRMNPNSAILPSMGISLPGVNAPSARTPTAPPANPAPASAPTTPSAAAPMHPSATGAAVNGAARKILFQYRNSKAKKVMIRADFTGWRAEPMQKNPTTNTWEYTGILEPGEYAYCFSVDDKSIRDPANKHTKQVGKTFVSSIIVQAKPAAKP